MNGDTSVPLYEYVCQACGKRIEVIQNVGERPLRTCPECGGKLRKAFSAPAIQFKGSGWYVTDYARGSGKSSGSEVTEKGEKAEKAEKAESGGTGEKAEKSNKGGTPEKAEKKETKNSGETKVSGEKKPARE